MDQTTTGNSSGEQDAQTNTSDTSPRTRKRRTKRQYHHSQRHNPLIAALIGMLLLVLVVLLFTGIKLTSLNTTNDVLQIKLQETQDELVQTRSALIKTQRELEATVQGRFPQLRRLELDKVLPIHDGYVKNIVFTMLKKSNEITYEYKLVLDNNSDTTGIPEVKVLVFDNLGVQLGGDELPKQEPLSRHETRSYSSIVDLVVPGEPHYFFVVGK